MLPRVVTSSQAKIGLTLGEVLPIHSVDKPSTHKETRIRSFRQLFHSTAALNDKENATVICAQAHPGTAWRISSGLFCQNSRRKSSWSSSSKPSQTCCHCIQRVMFHRSKRGGRLWCVRRLHGGSTMLKAKMVPEVRCKYLAFCDKPGIPGFD